MYWCAPEALAVAAAPATIGASVEFVAVAVVGERAAVASVANISLLGRGGPPKASERAFPRSPHHHLLRLLRSRCPCLPRNPPALNLHLLHFHRDFPGDRVLPRHDGQMWQQWLSERYVGRHGRRCCTQCREYLCAS